MATVFTAKKCYSLSELHPKAQPTRTATQRNVLTSRLTGLTGVIVSTPLLYKLPNARITHGWIHLKQRSHWCTTGARWPSALSTNPALSV